MKGRDSLVVWDGQVHTALFKMDLPHSTGNSARCHVAAWLGVEVEGEWIHVCAWLSPFALYLKLSPHG